MGFFKDLRKAFRLPRVSGHLWYPKYVVWEITLNCNLACKHCGSRAKAGRLRGNELSTDEALDLINQLADLGTEYITLSGGEPLLRRDWPVLVKELARRGIKVSIITNGTLISRQKEQLKALKDLIEVIAISVDGLEETHDIIRGRGVFSKVREAIETLREIGIPYGACTVVSKFNKGELEELFAFLKGEGFSYWQVQQVFLGGRMRDYSEFAPDEDDFIDLALFIAEKILLETYNNGLYIFPGDDIGYYSSIDYILWRNKGFPGCAAGRYGLGIEANGEIVGCLSLEPEKEDAKENPFAEGNIRERSLRDIWLSDSSFAYNRRIDKRKVKKPCRTCKYLPQCRMGCTAQAYYYTGDVYKVKFCLRAIEEKRGINLRDTLRDRLESKGYSFKRLEEHFLKEISQKVQTYPLFTLSY